MRPKEDAMTRYIPVLRPLPEKARKALDNLIESNLAGAMTVEFCDDLVTQDGLPVARVTVDTEKLMNTPSVPEEQLFKATIESDARLLNPLAKRDGEYVFVGTQSGYVIQQLLHGLILAVYSSERLFPTEESQVKDFSVSLHASMWQSGKFPAEWMATLAVAKQKPETLEHLTIDKLAEFTALLYTIYYRWLSMTVFGMMYMPDDSVFDQEEENDETRTNDE